MGSSCTVPSSADGVRRMIGVSPAPRSICCTTTLCTDHQAGIAIYSPASEDQLRNSTGAWTGTPASSW